MFQRPVLFGCVLAAAVGVPYLLLNEQLGKTAKSQWQRLTGGASPSSGTSPAPAASASPAVTPVAAATPYAVTIEEAFSFDVRPDWIVRRWPTVNTAAGEPKQLGMRVTLVTGTRPDDMAGSLTYFFDEYHQLQRITFTGQTGDARRLLATLVPRFGLRSRPTTGAAHYIAGDEKQPMSHVTLKYLPVIQGPPQAPRLDVAIDLRRADIANWDKRQVEAGEPVLLPRSYRQW